MSLDESCAMNMATTDSGFMCIPCGSFFKLKGSFKRHYRDAHYQPGIMFRCPSCKSTYKGQRSFSQHIYQKHRELIGLDFNICKL